MNVIHCPGCKASFPEGEGPTHAYMLSSPGCWATYGRVLAREYEDRRFAPIYRLAVDAYAVQHPGVPCRQAIQSVGVHLVRLCLVFERELPPARANDAMLKAARHKGRYVWLEPPASLGALTVADVDATSGVEEHAAIVHRWAEQMWQVWSPHHATVRAWASGIQGVLP